VGHCYYVTDFPEVSELCVNIAQDMRYVFCDYLQLYSGKGKGDPML